MSSRDTVSASTLRDAAAPRARFVRRARVGTVDATLAHRRAAIDGARDIAPRSADRARAN
jgi:hypothetical protein